MPNSPSEATESQRCGIIAIDLSTHRIRRITASPPGTLGDMEPSVSPDGHTIVFLRGVSYGEVDAYLVPAEGGTVRRFTFDNREITGFTWSPKGEALLICARGPDGVVRLIRRPIQGGPAINLTDGSITSAFPSDAGNNKEIAFTSYQHTESLYSAGAAGSRELISDPSYKLSPQLSPDGTRLAYVSDRTGYAEIWVSDADGRNSRRLTYSGGTGALMPEWSPDGTRFFLDAATADRATHA